MLRYVKNLNEEDYKEVLKELHFGFENLKQKWSLFSYLTPNLTPIEKEGKKFPFPLAYDLWEVHLILVGKKEYSHIVKQTILKVSNLVWLNAFYFNKNYLIEWENWSKTKVGHFIRCALIVEKINKKETINVKELSILSDMSPTAITKKIKNEKIIANKKEREWEISPTEVLNFLKKNNR